MASGQGHPEKPVGVSRQELEKTLGVLREDLDRTMTFWLDHSHDQTYGGFFTCLEADGTVFDELKYGWLQGRQVWMYARLYNEVKRFRTDRILNAALKGAGFLMSHINDPVTKKCAFLMTRDGRPVKVQRSIFTECFYVMAMSEMSRTCSASGDTEKAANFKNEALRVMDDIMHWVRVDSAGLGHPKLSGTSPTNSLAVPMMILCLADQLEVAFPDQASGFNELADWSIDGIRTHSQRNGTAILENVGEDGQELAGSAGRLMCPGHAIECGWFLLKKALSRNDSNLRDLAIQQFMNVPFDLGWDKQNGGIFYFLDVDGHSPTQLEWSQKLWWPHNEAMVSFLMAYSATGDVRHYFRFRQVMEYSYKHFVDAANGEWFGYLHRNGEINIHNKGGPFKGCFHVPRALMMCEQILERLLATTDHHFCE